MTTESEPFGVIILGNSGSGKSFLCNILIGKEQFVHEFRPTAVTTETEFFSVGEGDIKMRIYNVPGLIEAKQDRIDANKREIERAFKECPISTVIFVWTHNNGRVQNDDVIAFEALYKAFEFPKGSLAHVVNSLDPSRPSEFDAAFVVALSNLLKEDIKVDLNDFTFIDRIKDKDDEEMKKKAQLQLFALIQGHKAIPQEQKQEIDVKADQLKELRALLRQQQEDAARDRQNFQLTIENMQKMLKEAQEQKNQEIEKIKKMYEAMSKQQSRGGGTSWGEAVFDSFVPLGGIIRKGFF